MRIRYITPAVTPLSADGQLDFVSCENLYEHLVKGGVGGILILGSIGEFFGFTVEQKKQLISFAVKSVAHRVELIVGTASMIFDEIVALSNFALEEGTDAVMVVPPYYFHFTDESVLAFYDELAQRIHGNIYLYNFPERTGYDISPAVVCALGQKHSNIIGIKDTLGGMDHTRELIKQVRNVRPDFLIYSGFDDNFAHNVLCGGNGCVAGLSNLFPELTFSWVKAVESSDFEASRTIQRKIDRLMDIYAVGKPFVPFMKEAMVLRGIIRYGTATRPMPVVTEEQRAQLRSILERI